MSGLYGIFNSARSGLQAQQYSLNITSNNISNASTEGYTRQVINIQTSSTYSLQGIGQLGTGVDVVSITRVRDELLDEQIRQETSNHESFKAKENVLSQVEMIFQEPGETGLSTVMNNMWESWQELSKTPESSNARTVVVQNALAFTDTLNHMSSQLDNLESNIVTSLETEAYNVNSILGQIGELNGQIHKLEIKDIEANDLYDRRDVLLDGLSKMVDFNTEKDEFNRVRITEADSGNSYELLPFNKENTPQREMSVIRKAEPDGSGGYNITLAKNGDTTDMHTINVTSGDYKDGDVIYTEPSNWDDYINGVVTEPNLDKVDLGTGSMAGEIDSIEYIDNYQSSLDKAAYSIATSINKLHINDGTGENGIDFYTTNDGSSEITAANITVSQDIQDDYTKINAGKTATSPSGNGERALAIAQLRNGAYPIDDTANLKAYIDANYDSSTMDITSSVAGASYDSYYTDIVALIGTQAQSAIRGSENQESLLLQLDQRKESISGVSLDEETANLIKFQTAYQANARVISTLEEMLNTLVNRMGV